MHGAHSLQVTRGQGDEAKAKPVVFKARTTKATIFVLDLSSGSRTVLEACPSLHSELAELKRTRCSVNFTRLVHMYYATFCCVIMLINISTGMCLHAVLVYKCTAMASSCGRCRSIDPAFNCGWCLTTRTCTIQLQCVLSNGSSGWLHRHRACPDPAITSVC